MGYKRPLDASEFRDLPFKQSQRFGYGNEMATFAETDPCNNAIVKPFITVSGEEEDGFCDIQWYDALHKDTVTEVSHVGDKDAETSTHLRSSSSEDDDAGSGATSLSSLSSDCFQFYFPLRTFVPLDDDYSSLNCAPRRLVPTGPNHQASIPTWRGSVHKMSGRRDTSNSHSFSPALGSNDVIGTDNEEKLMGTCVISMPDSSFSSSNSAKGGDWRIECNCLDCGSVRCVRQHVAEARENLKKTLGHESFMNLGFGNLGEEVACKWSEEEEEVFHEIVYSNPASSGRSFWKRLSGTFPSRSKKELVSFYYNVFILRRRAVQNRSRVLDIDSDDDEYHGSNAMPYNFDVLGEDENSAIESLDDQDDYVGNQENYSDKDDGNDDVDDTVGNDSGNSTEENGGSDQVSEACKLNSFGRSMSGSVAQNVSQTSVIAKEDFSAQEDSCMSFDCQSNMVDSYGSLDAGTVSQVGGFKSDHNTQLAGKLEGPGDWTNQVYLFDSCDTKHWFPSYLTADPLKLSGAAAALLWFQQVVGYKDVD
ncbi:AT-rich interactive domain-containing protein 2 [Quillaja saponaria]|uniref:AT-rich interactive domain-containing protein 2 n=1 Tax=Quillaja saponaria TaxID=32244 RepID=A0AAD7P6B7_QUISA|nr:AT-rich interactive domain-containing protein 2 [Quillaja saponaria]